VDLTLEDEINLANLGVDQNMELISGLCPLWIGDEVVGDGVVLRKNYDEADFTDPEDQGEEEAFADFTDSGE